MYLYLRCICFPPLHSRHVFVIPSSLPSSTSWIFSITQTLFTTQNSVHTIDFIFGTLRFACVNITSMLIYFYTFSLHEDICVLFPGGLLCFYSQDFILSIIPSPLIMYVMRRGRARALRKKKAAPTKSE